MSSFLEVFDYYFLAMMLFSCFILYFFESKGFKQQGDINGYNIGRKVAVVMGGISFVLFIVARFQ